MEIGGGLRGDLSIKTIKGVFTGNFNQNRFEKYFSHSKYLLNYLELSQRLSDIMLFGMISTGKFECMIA